MCDSRPGIGIEDRFPRPWDRHGWAYRENVCLSPAWIGLALRILGVVDPRHLTNKYEDLFPDLQGPWWDA